MRINNNKTLKKHIFPIYVSANTRKNKDIILDYNKSKEISIKDFEIPNNLFLNKVCTNKIKTPLESLLINFIMDKYGKQFFKHKRQIIKTEKPGLPGLELLFIDYPHIYNYLKKILIKLFESLYSSYDDEYILNNMLNKSKITILYYSHDKNGYIGSEHHIDSTYVHKGAISVISFEDSVLDFIPFNELKDKPPFRVMIPENYAITFDGNLRHYYTHGIPSKIKYPNKYRYAINIRHPSIDTINNDTNCDLNKFFESEQKCYSSVSAKPLKFIS